MGKTARIADGLVIADGLLRPSDAALDFLRAHDRRLGAVIDAVGVIERKMNLDPFAGVIHHIVGQQISGKAQATIWARLMDAVASVEREVPESASGTAKTNKTSTLSPEVLLALGVDGIRNAGMSGVKAERILEVARRTATGEIDFHALAQRPDQEVIDALVALPGVGVWTAEMLLIFTFGRSNVLSFGDFGIRSGLMRLYGHKDLPRARFERYRKRYAPFGTAASLYLWKVGNGEVDPSVWKAKKREDSLGSPLKLG